MQVARHPRRPYALDYVRSLCTDFQELHGDRQFKDDQALIAKVGKETQFEQRELWEGRLDRLEDYLETLKAKERESE